MTTTLSPRTALVLAAIEAFWRDHGYSPNIREVAAACGYHGTGAAEHHIRKLREAGYITWERGLSRTIVLVRRGA